MKNWFIEVVSVMIKNTEAAFAAGRGVCCAIKLPVYDKMEFYDLLQRFMETVDAWRKMIELVGQTKPLMSQVRPETPPPAPGEVRFDV